VEGLRKDLIEKVTLEQDLKGGRCGIHRIWREGLVREKEEQA
jgi:hypothetical protein